MKDIWEGSIWAILVPECDIDVFGGICGFGYYTVGY